MFMEKIPAYIYENEASEAQLKKLLTRLNNQELQRPLEAGWTVASMLAHLAFWDQRALLLIRQWKQQGIGPSPADTDILNEAMRGLFLRLAPHDACEMCLAYAVAVDAEIKSLDPQLALDIMERGTAVRLNRAVHRSEHLAQIQEALK
jgi:hypothetical protein